MKPNALLLLGLLSWFCPSVKRKRKQQKKTFEIVSSGPEPVDDNVRLNEYNHTQRENREINQFVHCGCTNSPVYLALKKSLNAVLVISRWRDDILITPFLFVPRL